MERVFLTRTVCLYVCARMCVFMYVCTRTHVCTRTCMFVCLYVCTRMYVCMYICTCMQRCIQDFCQGGANLEYVKKRGGEAVCSPQAVGTKF